jgi:hypothetical protein
VGQGRLDDLVIGTSRRPGLPDRPGRPHARPATPARSGPRTRRTAPASAMPPAETAASASSPDWPACVTAASSPAPGSSWECQDLQLTRGSPGRRGAGSAPCAGLTPTSTAAAIPSGTLLIASGNPATRSARSYRRSGRTEPSTGRPQPKAGESCSTAGFPSGSRCTGLPQRPAQALRRVAATGAIDQRRGRARRCPLLPSGKACRSRPVC